jgi:ketosteroid isomerase-like protein
MVQCHTSEFMSRHVEAVRRTYQAWGEGDISTIRELFAPDVVADGGVLWPEGKGSVRGVDAVMRAFASIMAAFERSELIPEGFLEAGDTLVAPLLWRGVSAASRSVVEQRLIAAYGFRDDQIASIAWFGGLDEALDALGLPRSFAEGVFRR